MLQATKKDSSSFNVDESFALLPLCLDILKIKENTLFILEIRYCLFLGSMEVSELVKRIFLELFF